MCAVVDGKLDGIPASPSVGSLVRPRETDSSGDSKAKRMMLLTMTPPLFRPNGKPTTDSLLYTKRPGKASERDRSATTAVHGKAALTEPTECGRLDAAAGRVQRLTRKGLMESRRIVPETRIV